MNLKSKDYDDWEEEQILKAYKEAAECDEYLFGDYNFCEEWMNDV